MCMCVNFIMNGLDRHHCSWCSTNTDSEAIKIEDHCLDHDGSIRLLLELLGLSPTLLDENIVYRLCSGCIELVSNGTELRVQLDGARTNFIKKILLDQLEEIKTKLRVKSRKAFPLYTGTKTSKKSGNTLGISLSQCFTECMVQIRPEDKKSVHDFQKHVATGGQRFSETPSETQKVKLCPAEIKHEGFNADILQDHAIVDWSKLKVGKSAAKHRDLKLKFYHVSSLMQLNSSLDAAQLSENVSVNPKLPENNNSDVDGMYECAGCSEIFVTLQAKNDHETLHLLQSKGRGRYVCGFCEVEFAKLVDLRRHKQVHEQRPFVCHFCGKIFGDQDRLIEHVDNHSALRFQCEMCNKKFRTLWKLILLQKTHNGKKRYLCKPCNKSCMQKQFRIRHLQMNSRAQDSSPVQQEALTDDSLDPLGNVSISSSAGVETSKKLSEELRTDASETVTTSYEFVSIDEIVNRHSVQERREGLLRTINCLNLNEKLVPKPSQATALEDHEYEFDKPRETTLVSPGPSLKMTPSMHHSNLMAKGGGAFPFECRVCNKKFRESIHLKNHEIYHSEDRPFVCSDCQLTFKSSANLANHRRRHFGRHLEKRYKCLACGNSYTQSHSLKSHLRAHPECI